LRNRFIQAALVSGLILVTVLLYFANRKPPVKKEGPGQNMPVAIKMDEFLKNAFKNLPSNSRAQWTEIQKNTLALSGAEKTRWLDSASAFWDSQSRPDIASVFSRKKAENTGAAKDWIFAGQRFYYSVRFVKDESEKPALYSNAIASLEKGIQLDPGNTDAKIDLAACMVEGTQDPMKGITMLREIEKTDSMNLKLQLSFAMFSANSGQWDRAINRFKKVLQIDSNYIEAYLHLADAYEQTGELEKTIEALEKYAAKTDDLLARTTIKEYIIKLKKNKK
jgi:tetratricopeptide (TPR) repeat protein